jgi:hypothetical protein
VTGNVGTSLLRAVAAYSAIDSIVGIARRRPVSEFARIEWAEADVATAGRVPLFRDAGCAAPRCSRSTRTSAHLRQARWAAGQLDALDLVAEKVERAPVLQTLTMLAGAPPIEG